MLNNPEDLIGVTEAAGILGVTAETVRDWSTKNKITTFRTLGGHRRFRRGDVLALRDAGRTAAGAA